MLKTISGDLLDMKDGIICHQTNYLGSMGGGVAAAIKDKLLTKAQYQTYQTYCRQAGRTALGTVQFLAGTPGVTVANMFCQDDARTRQARVLMQGASITDYDAMRRCLIRVRSMAKITGQRVYMPYHLGCGIAGGDWKTVEFIIREVFEDYPVDAYIIRRPAE